MKLNILRTDSKNPDFIALVKLLDSYLKTTDGDEHDFYNQFNNIDVLKHVVIAYKDNKPVGCGAFKPFNNVSVEIKRMFTKPEFRGQNIARTILQELENWAQELAYKNTVLETGKRQTEAVNFYNKCGYSIIPNYGQYKHMENSLCFKKELS
ncbi:acetyltransferase (GNAT) family protein [Lacinutrix venerupis]|uniref:GNAT family N-acetyltransferase n=1 Tax=Lacinutrix venerupis TaxID=1486034 RepID=UPI000EAED36E|nr:GNAT family N-acetyltransferase [Lacinutrix venerupis]RLJ62384.1 acetyltransferase (GNAT) family protein [Lacinutrix venerupis]